jgi:hypothetical protein
MRVVITAQTAHRDRETESSRASRCQRRARRRLGPVRTIAALEARSGEGPASHGTLPGREQGARPLAGTTPQTTGVPWRTSEPHQSTEIASRVQESHRAGWVKLSASHRLLRRASSEHLSSEARRRLVSSPMLSDPPFADGALVRGRSWDCDQDHRECCDDDSHIDPQHRLSLLFMQRRPRRSFGTDCSATQVPLGNAINL